MVRVRARLLISVCCEVGNIPSKSKMEFAVLIGFNSDRQVHRIVFD